MKRNIWPKQRPIRLPHRYHKRRHSRKNLSCPNQSLSKKRRRRFPQKRNRLRPPWTKNRTKKNLMRNPRRPKRNLEVAYDFGLRLHAPTEPDLTQDERYSGRR